MGRTFAKFPHSKFEEKLNGPKTISITGLFKILSCVFAIYESRLQLKPKIWVYILIYTKNIDILLSYI